MKNYIENPLVAKINNMLRSCTICKNYNTRGGVFLTKDTYDVDVIFIAQNPGAGNYNKNVDPSQVIPFALHDDSNNYHLFFDLFRESFVKKFKKEPVMYVTNVSKCSTHDNSLNDVQMIDNCISKYLKTEMEFLFKKNQNIKIITLGKYAREVFESENELQRYKTINLFHPGFMNRKGPQFIQEQIQTLIEKFGDDHYKTIKLL